MTDPQEPATLMDPDDEFEPAPDDPPPPVSKRHERQVREDLEIPPSARTMRNLRDRRRVIE